MDLATTGIVTAVVVAAIAVTVVVVVVVVVAVVVVVNTDGGWDIALFFACSKPCCIPCIYFSGWVHPD